jgi:hypothetical protein
VLELRLRLVRRCHTFAGHAKTSLASTSVSMVRQRQGMVVQADEIRLARRHRGVAAGSAARRGRRAT